MIQTKRQSIYFSETISFAKQYDNISSKTLIQIVGYESICRKVSVYYPKRELFEAKHLLVSDRICLIVLREYLSQALFYVCAYDRNCRNVLREILS